MARSFLISFELKKKFFSHLIKLIRSIDKYTALKKDKPTDLSVHKTVTAKLAEFSKVHHRLHEIRHTLHFVPLDKLRSPNPKKENTIGFNSTMNEYSEVVLGFGRRVLPSESSRTIQTGQNDSGFGSMHKVFDSVKTDQMSRMSDKQFLSDVKKMDLVNNSSLINEKMKELDEKYAALVALVDSN